MSGNESPGSRSLGIEVPEEEVWELKSGKVSQGIEAQGPGVCVCVLVFFGQEWLSTPGF